MKIFRTKKNILMLLVLAVAFIALSGLSINRASRAARSLYPLINDTWYNVLNVIKEKTPEQTVLNSWWDYGDWFKVIARRRVIFDGQSQDKPQAYWMAKAMLTSSEEESIRILRMLNNGGNKAFEIINEHVEDPLEAVLLLEAALSLPWDRVEKTLLDFIPDRAAKDVISLLFNTPSSAVFIVESTLVSKMTAISYLGNWDFSKVHIAQNFDKQEKDYIIEHLKKLGRRDEDIQRFYQEVFLISTKRLDEWLSNKLQFYSPLVNGYEKDDNVVFQNGFIYNPRDRTISSNSGQVPMSLFLLEGNNFMEMSYPNANVRFSALVYQEKVEGREEMVYKCILLDRPLANSIFARLYFFNGMGLRHFNSFIDVKEGNNYIRVFNIIW